MRWTIVWGTAWLACSAGMAAGQWQNPYEEHHAFTLGVRVRPGETYRGRWTSYINAEEFHDWRPPGLEDRHEASETIVLPPGGGAGIATTRPLVCAPDAQANAGFQLGLDAQGRPAGSVDVWGHADLALAPAIQRASAKSQSSLVVQTGVERADGTVRWRPRWHAAGSAWGSTREKSRDPIMIRALDLDTGLWEESTLWDSLIDIRGAGSSTWEDGRLEIDADEGEFFVTIAGPGITTATGSMHLEFAGGIVTRSEDDGMFDGFLPGLGASSRGIAMMLGDAEGAFDIGFDLGTTSLSGYELTATFANDGEAFAVIPSSSGLAVLAAAGVLTLAARPRRPARG